MQISVIAGKVDSVRIDRWLWAARFFKTRNLAGRACQAGKVKINGKAVKPARNIMLAEELQITRPDYKQSVRVTGLIEKRVGAKLVNDLYEDITPESEKEQLALRKNVESAFVSIKRDQGRPTKKERRDIERFRERNFRP